MRKACTITYACDACGAEASVEHPALTPGMFFAEDLTKIPDGWKMLPGRLRVRQTVGPFAWTDSAFLFCQDCQQPWQSQVREEEYARESLLGRARKNYLPNL